MTSQNGTTDRPMPAYIPFPTFTGFLDRLGKMGVPPRIDTSAMGDLSNGTKSGIRSGIRFLGLIDQEFRTLPKLRELVSARGTDQWPEAMKALVLDAYGSILDGLDLNEATAKMVDERFREKANAQGQMLTKGVRFFLTALDEAKIPISAHLKAKGVRSSPSSNGSGKSPRKNRAKKASEIVDPLTAAFPQEPSGDSKVHSFPLRPAFEMQVRLPKDVKKVDIDRACAFLQLLPFND